MNHRLALTTGDPLGIGKKIVELSLKKLGPKKKFQFMVWTDSKAKTFKIPSFQTLVFQTGKQALKHPFKENQILQIKSPLETGDQLEEAAKLCLNKQASALITGPVSKGMMKKQKRKAISQTDLLKKLCKKQTVFMCFRGRFFNTLLLTDHIPLKKVSIDKPSLKKLLILALKARILLPKNQQTKPLGILGLNPHCGEGGLIGKEEKTLLYPLLQSFSSKNVQGPLSPDVAFLRKNWTLYSFFVALYHDQGLIPFKLVHSHKGFAQSLGLPFLRLGVDHGTGRGLKNKDISYESFFSAIKEALRIISLNKEKRIFSF